MGGALVYPMATLIIAVIILRIMVHTIIPIITDIIMGIMIHITTAMQTGTQLIMVTVERYRPELLVHVQL